MTTYDDLGYGDKKNGSVCRMREKAGVLRRILPSYIGEKEFGVLLVSP
jgi:hypothetical protein